MRAWLRNLLSRVIARLDQREFDKWADTPNGSARLVAFHDAVLDADDTLQAIGAALNDGDTVEAHRLVVLGRDSLIERIAELKELL